jgi:hypothetical protein
VQARDVEAEQGSDDEAKTEGVDDEAPADADRGGQDRGDGWNVDDVISRPTKLSARIPADLHAGLCLTACCRRRAERSDLRRLHLGEVAGWQIVLAAILAAHPGMRGVLFDLPHVIADATNALAERGVDDRGDCVAGDFFASVPAGGDGYLLSLVLHDWPDPQARCILRNVAAASVRGARLLIIEFVVPPGDTLHLSKMVDVTILAMAGGNERTEPEWRELLTAAGFTGIAVRHTGATMLSHPRSSAMTTKPAPPAWRRPEMPAEHGRRPARL